MGFVMLLRLCGGSDWLSSLDLGVWVSSWSDCCAKGVMGDLDSALGEWMVFSLWFDMSLARLGYRKGVGS